jgi:NitT/TauT family transport system permease protein
MGLVLAPLRNAKHGLCGLAANRGWTIAQGSSMRAGKRCFNEQETAGTQDRKKYRSKKRKRHSAFSLEIHNALLPVCSPLSSLCLYRQIPHYPILRRSRKNVIGAANAALMPASAPPIATRFSAASRSFQVDRTARPVHRLKRGADLRFASDGSNPFNNSRTPGPKSKTHDTGLEGAPKSEGARRAMTMPTSTAGGRRIANISATVASAWPNRYDVIVFLAVGALFLAVAHGAKSMHRPLEGLEINPVSLDSANLPQYALLTTLRMFAALGFSLLFTFIVAPLATKSKKAERVIIPALDILQSVPVLGFLTFTVVFFMSLFPGSELGAELAAIFAIFTSQAWNMTFSFYQSLKTIPHDLDEVTTHFHLSQWQRFWKLEAPFATPGLVWNMMMSMSGGWFFVVASEAISVGDTKIALPGIGSYLSLAIDQRNIEAVGWAVAAMAVVIMLYDQLIFRPVVAWADKFRVEVVAAQATPHSWVLDLLRRARFVTAINSRLGQAVDVFSGNLSNLSRQIPEPKVGSSTHKLLDWAWNVALLALVIWAAWSVIAYVRASLGWPDLEEAITGGFITFLRVVILIAVASLIWVPIGVYIGLRPALAERVQPVAQFLAAFPANVLFPFVVLGIATYHLNPDIWLSPLIVLGTQWYILFNVIAGASVFPSDLTEACTLYRIKRWQWWRKVILPGIFPYYVTGALTASGGSWNASIIAEVVSWGDTKLEAHGLGAYIAKATNAGDFHRVVLGVGVMSVFVVILNRALWRRLYVLADRRLRID